MQRVEAMAQVRYTDAAGLPSALKGAESLFVWDFVSTAVADAWPSADRLRWIHIASAGVDRLLFPDLVGSSVVVTNSRGIFDRPIAEYVLGLVLAIAKDLPTTLQLQREGSWQHRETQRIDTQCALVIGTGSIGRAVGALLRAAGMSVSGVGRTARGDDADLGVVHAASDLAELLPAADYVVVAAPLTDSTRGMFGAEAFARMKGTAWLVNVGRGALLVEDDLLTALGSGEIGGAALDVFRQEPLPTDHPLWTMPNVIVSPHMSGDFVGWLEALVALFADNVDRWLAGQPLRNEVDKQAGYVTST
jgi:phosphoglycerate dehydrogenase-like enzyme